MKAMTLASLLTVGLTLSGCDLIKDALDTGDDTTTDDGATTDSAADDTATQNTDDTATRDTGDTAPQDSGDTGGADTGPADTGPTDTGPSEALEAIIDFECAGDPCIELSLSAAESLGDIASYTWIINGEETADAGEQQISVNLTVDALDTLSLTVADKGGRVDTQTLYALATDSGFTELEVLDDPQMTVITGPLGVCGTLEPNRVVSIGGCITDTLEIRFQDAGLPPGPGNAVYYDVSGNALNSLGFAVGAAWAQAPGAEQFAGDVNASNYGFGSSYTYRKAVQTSGADHFSFYFYGQTAGVTTLQSLHLEQGAGPGDTPVWVAADQAIQFSCEGSGEPSVVVTGVDSGGVAFP